MNNFAKSGHTGAHHNVKNCEAMYPTKPRSENVPYVFRCSEQSMVTFHHCEEVETFLNFLLMHFQTKHFHVSEMMQSDWLKLVTGLATANQNASFKSRVNYSTLNFYMRLARTRMSLK